MKYILYFPLLYLFLGAACGSAGQKSVIKKTNFVEERNEFQYNPDSTVTIFCVRHAEKASDIGNPSLTTLGLKRASDLSHSFSNVALDAIYSTDFIRTRETAAPCATNKGLPIAIYDAYNISDFAASVIQNHKGESVLIVGHSNTTPQLVNALTKRTEYTDFDESKYDNLFIVTINNNGASDVIQLSYGAATP